MDRIAVILSVICILAAAAAIWIERKRTKQTFDKIEKMLEEAIEDSFTEKTFDESRLSALEAKFARYLSSSVTSSKNVAAERDKIKTLISDISHQTKTPIANLLLYCDLLKEQDLTEEFEADVSAIRRQADRLRFLVDALVKLSRLETGIISLSPREESLQPMMQEILDEFREQAEEAGLDLTMKKTEAQAVFDPKWTTEAISNIVDNAIKYTDSGRIVISAKSYEMFVCIDISDTGRGILEEEQANIFSRFYRSEDVKEEDGVGIGLYLAREIISREGGYMKLSSSLGKGSIFSVFLPRKNITITDSGNLGVNLSKL